MIWTDENEQVVNFRLTKEFYTKQLSVVLMNDNCFEIYSRNSSNYLSSNELTYYNKVKIEKRKISYLMGRVAAKKALSQFVPLYEFASCSIDPGYFNQPVIIIDQPCCYEVSITHCDGMAAAIAFSQEVPMGIDVEQINFKRIETMQSQMSRDEIKLLDFAPVEISSAMFWTAKEALSKALKLGMMINFATVEISQIKLINGKYFGQFKNYSSYQFVSFVLPQHVLTIVFPNQLNISFDSHATA